MTVVARTVDGTRFRTEIKVGGHSFHADEPLDMGGADAGPSPYDLLLAALGACTAMTVRMYAESKGWGPVQVTVTLEHDRIHATDCAECMSSEGHVDRVRRQVSITGDLTDEQRDQLRAVADRCPVHQTLISDVIVENQPA